MAKENREFKYEEKMKNLRDSFEERMEFLKKGTAEKKAEFEKSREEGKIESEKRRQFLQDKLKELDEMKKGIENMRNNILMSNEIIDKPTKNHH